MVWFGFGLVDVGEVVQQVAVVVLVLYLVVFAVPFEDFALVVYWLVVVAYHLPFLFGSSV